MAEISSSHTRRCFLVTAASAGAAGLLPSQSVASTAANAIRPFRVSVPKEALFDLRRRIAATLWPDRETVTDHSQGVQLAKIKPLVEYWGTSYDWCKAEAKLNALPQFVTEIDGLDIQFIHVRSRHPNALPLIMTHGWPGSPLELLKTIGPLRGPHGARRTRRGRFPSRSPDVPGLRVLGASPTRARTGAPAHVARAWHEFDGAPGIQALRRSRRRLGRDCLAGNGSSSAGGAARHPHQHARHRCLPSLLQAHPQPQSRRLSTFSTAEKTAFRRARVLGHGKGFGYAEMMNTRPQTPGIRAGGLAGPRSLAFFYDKFGRMDIQRVASPSGH